ncbi:unnamed protein product [Albugo candida]|uniref:Nickel insertion protein n=2 Tax=Albugo candida TaxID=65357 RepID=A0A024GM20_9STRA|nr:unnamed protein product [Albugo candida]|eukprot:CCI47787.1 unnamed protein product [Albugo candida]
MLAYLDCSAGVAGDMLLGALIDAVGFNQKDSSSFCFTFSTFQGAPIEKLRDGLQSLLELEGEWEIHVAKVWRGSGKIYSTKVSVVSKHPLLPAVVGPGKPENRVEAAKTRIQSTIAKEPTSPVTYKGVEQSHPHEHHGITHIEDPTPPHSHSHHHGPERNLSDIKSILEKSNLSDWVKAQSLQTFELLAEAEACVHGTTTDQIHFHEVGAIDSIIDTVGTILALELMDIREVYASYLPYSSGHIHCLHGLMPIPSPATLQLLKGIPVCPAPKGAHGELVTPTGISLVKSLAISYGQPPPFVPELVGCGAGTKDFTLHPNIVRVVIGRRLDSFSSIFHPSHSHRSTLSMEKNDENSDTVSVLQANLDDMNPQVLGYVQERLLSNGALDVWTQHIQMKKNRPGILLSVMCHANMENLMQNILFQETTTLGIRRNVLDRVIAGRAEICVDAFQRSARVKTGYWNGKIVNIYPEYEDCKQIAKETDVPLLQVIQRVQLAAQQTLTANDASA